MLDRLVGGDLQSPGTVYQGLIVHLKKVIKRGNNYETN